MKLHRYLIDHLILHPLVNLRQQFSAHVFAARRFPAHQALGSRNNVHTIAAEHFRNLTRADIHTPAGSRNSFQMRDRGSAARIVTKKNTNTCASGLRP